MASSAPCLGESVALARHQAARCGGNADQRSQLVLASYVEQFELAQLDGAPNGKSLAKALYAWLPTISPRDDALESACAALLGTHDAWKVFDRIACPLAVSAKGTGLGDVTTQQFCDVVQGEDSRYLEAAGMPAPLQMLLADYARILWDSELLNPTPAPEAETAEGTEETTPPATDTEIADPAEVTESPTTSEKQENATTAGDS